MRRMDDATADFVAAVGPLLCFLGMLVALGAC
jgi:hypothetical protein